MLGSLSQPVILLPLLSFCFHQKESYKQQKLILLWILLGAAASQGIIPLLLSLWDVLGEVLPGEGYSVCWPGCMRHDSVKIAGCLDAAQFMKDIHYYFSNYIGFLEMYLIVFLEWVVFTFSSLENRIFLLM